MGPFRTKMVPPIFKLGNFKIRFYFQKLNIYFVAKNTCINYKKLSWFTKISTDLTNNPKNNLVHTKYADTPD